MIKETNKITKNNLDLSSLEDNQLSIQLSLDGFSFCIYNRYTNCLDAFVTYQFETTINSPQHQLNLIKSIFENEPLLNENYKNVIVSHCNNLVTQVPKPFFDKNNLENYLQYTVKVLENDFIAFDEIDNTEIVNVYIPFVNINNFLLEKYGGFTYKHSSTILIENLVRIYKNSNKQSCFVNVTNNWFEIVVVKNKKLELYNCFNFTTKEDFIYYILFVAEQLKLNPEEFELILMGDIEKDSELYTIAYNYIRNVDFYKPQNKSHLIKDVSPHSHFTLLNQY